MNASNGIKKIFVSYAHLDREEEPELYKKIFTYLEALQADPTLAIFRDTQIDTGADWYEVIKAEVKDCSAGVLLVGPGFMGSDFINKKELPALFEQADTRGLPILPLVTQPVPVIAPWMKRLNAFEHGHPLSDDEGSALNRRLSSFVEELHARVTETPAPPAKDNIDLSRLPGWEDDRKRDTTLVARDEQQAALLKFWGESVAGPNVVELVAPGGVGKTALSLRFAQDLRKAGWEGAEKVFAWSFYSQGADGANASTGTFFHDALEFFDERPEEGTSAIRLAEDLAKVMAEGRNLLILDGLEPLQFAANAAGGLEGRLKEPAMALFLRRCARARQMQGMVLISTRVNVTNLDEMRYKRHERIDLDDLTPEQGRAVLRHFGLTGSDAKLEDLSREYGNHTLALRLLASYGEEYGQEEIFTLPEFEGPDDGLPKTARPARRVMEAFANRLEPAQVATLHVLGLFDRPATKGELNALKSSAIAGLTDAWSEGDDWRGGGNVSDLGLALLTHKRTVMDAHPLIREHFGMRMKLLDEATWAEGHSKLSDFLSHQAREKPKTLAEMQPLLSAMAHGCLAERKNEMLFNLYWRRINQQEDFCTKKLGAMGPELNAFAAMFPRPYSDAAPDLPTRSKALVYNLAGFWLRSLGRCSEAVDAFQSAIRQLETLGDPKDVSAGYVNLSETLLSVGKIVPGALKDSSLRASQFGTALAGSSNETDVFINSCGFMATARHCMGQPEAARRLFRIVERVQCLSETDTEYLYSLRGFQYRELLLDSGEVKEVLSRALVALAIERRNGWLLDIGHSHLSIGHARLILEGPKAATTSIQRAIEFIYQSGQISYVSPAHVVRAEMYRRLRNFVAAHEDLEDSFDISRASGLKLHLCDTHLEAGRLAVAEGEREVAQHHYEQAAAIIEETGYHRRDKARDALAAEIAAMG
ncbi:MAG: TIR and AAA domain-containing protein [Pseudomonadota bacterium]